jgi:cytochrome c-type biogenesis protein CcmE
MKHRLNLGQILGLVIVIGSVSAIAYQATRAESTVTFYTPEEVYAEPTKFKGKVFRVSGLVLAGTRHWNPESKELQFRMTDLKGHEFKVNYVGIPPDLFKEGQGVIVEGRLSEEMNEKNVQVSTSSQKLSIQAKQLLVKHSEVYDTKEDHSKLREAKLLDSILKDQR